MKYFLIGERVYAYPLDGSQDHLIPSGAQAVTAEFVATRNSRTPSVDAQRVEVWRRIVAKRTAITAGGVLVSGHWYHTDPTSKIQHLGNKDTARDMLDAGALPTDALLDPVTGNPIVWRVMSGVYVPMTIQIALDVVRAGKALELAAFAAAETHRTALAQAANPGEYDFSGGWPAVYQGG